MKEHVYATYRWRVEESGIEYKVEVIDHTTEVQVCVTGEIDEHTATVSALYQAANDQWRTNGQTNPTAQTAVMNCLSRVASLLAPHSRKHNRIERAMREAMDAILLEREAKDRDYHHYGDV